MRKIGNPARCCCNPCPDNPRQFCWASAGDCCGLPATPTVTLTFHDDAGTVLTGTGNSGCIDISEVAEGTTFDWVIACGSLPNKAGSGTVPACGGTLHATAEWTIDESVPHTLTCTVTGPDPIVTGAWTAFLIYQGSAPGTYGTFGSGTFYTWVGTNSATGYGYHLGPNITCYAPHPGGTCSGDGIDSPYPDGTVRQTYGTRRAYGSAAACMTIFVPDDDKTNCQLAFYFRNYWGSVPTSWPLGVPAGGVLEQEDTASLANADNCVASGWCNNHTCPCGVGPYPSTVPPVISPQDPSTIIPDSTYPSYYYNAWDMTSANSDLSAACSPPDWSGTASWPQCPSAGTVTITG